MTHQVALSFEDGVTRFITCAPDQTVADASYRQRINIPLDCRDGACGTCKAFCESGDYDGGTYIDDALTSDEAERGYVLPCSMMPRSDLVLRIATTSAVAKTQAATYPATVTAVERLSPTTVALTLKTAERDTLAFLPGQYVNIAVPGTEETRSYSFSSAPDDELLTFLIKIAPGGVMSEYLTQRAEPGDELTFTGPHGSFFLRESDRPVLLLAGGTGLAPILSILRTMRAGASKRPVHLVYGVTTDDDLVETHAVRELAAELDGFTWDYCVADPGSTAANKGYVTTLIRDEHLHGGDVAVYLCGPPPMVEAVREHFAADGFEPAGFHYEKFSLAAEPPEPTTETAPEVPETSETLATSETDETDVTEETVGTTVEPEDIAEAGRILVPAAAPEPELRTGEHTGASRTLAGQAVFPQVAITGLGGGSARPAEEDTATANAIAGQRIWSGTGRGTATLDTGEAPIENRAARSIAGQEVLSAQPDLRPLVTPTPASEVGDRTTARRLTDEHAQRSQATTRQAMAEAESAKRPRFVTPGRFTGKVVVVTGSAQGIGEQTARRVAAEGGDPVLADRSELVEGLADELACESVVADLETWEGAEAVMDAALARHGRIDVLINNVGGAIWFKPFTEFTPDQIEAELRRSLLTTLFACRAALPSMRERGTGVIVNVSSAATRGVHRIPYSAAKGGINAVTASLALECADAGIRVVATAPGGTEAPPRRISRGGSALGTEQEQAWFQAHIDQTLDSSLLKRYGTLDEQAAAITFLASEEASYVTGSILPVAGGDLG